MIRVSEMRAVESTVIHLELDGALLTDDARRLRGAVAARMQRPEFHHHGTRGLIYHSPLIRYDTSDVIARLMGLGDGALLLRDLPQFESLRLGDRDRVVREQVCRPGRCEVGPTGELRRYRFRSPYLPLNQENFDRWRRADDQSRRELLERIVVGNLLSFAKGVGLNVSERLRAETDLQPFGWQTLKPGVRLLAFTGAISVNFQLPDGWGLGKSIARGFGTLHREEEN